MDRPLLNNYFTFVFTQDDSIRPGNSAVQFNLSFFIPVLVFRALKQLKILFYSEIKEGELGPPTGARDLRPDGPFAPTGAGSPDCARHPPIRRALQ